MRVFLSVAEDSADLHAAALVRAARARGYAWKFFGLTGPRLRALGVDSVFDLTAHAAMLTGIFAVIGHALAAVRAAEAAWSAAPPDVVVLLDSPELNLRLAARAKARGLPVLYYIAPQTWASRAGRNARIRRVVDRLACILPFEEDYFRRQNIHAEYVGHPLIESLALPTSRAVPIAPSDQVAAPLALSGNGQAAPTPSAERAGSRYTLALLPGSRRHVIDAMLPRQMAVARSLHASGVPLHLRISCAGPARRAQIEEQSRAARLRVPIEIFENDNAQLLGGADLTLVASGTATLEVAWYGSPMIVMYDAGPLLAAVHRCFGRHVVKTPHLSLVNILAGRRVAPEFMPFVPDIEPIAEVARQLLRDEDWRSRMRRDLAQTLATLTPRCASARVCEIIAELGREAHRR